MPEATRTIQPDFWQRLFGRRQPEIQTYATQYFAPPEVTAENAADLDLEEIRRQIDQLDESIRNAPDWVGESRPEHALGVQENIDALNAAMAQAEGFLAVTTTAPPTEVDVLGDDPVLLQAWRDEGTVESPNWIGGRITIPPEKFRADAESGRMMYEFPWDWDESTGQMVQRTDLPKVFVYEDPDGALEEEWNIAHYTPAYQQQAQLEGPTGGGAAGAAEGSVEQRWMTMLEGLMSQLAQPVAEAPRFISREEAAAREAQPQEAQAGFQQQNAQDALRMLMQFGGSMFGG